MLPDFPDIKERLQKAMLESAYAQAISRGIVAEVPPMRIFEGTHWAVTSDNADEIPAFSYQIEISNDEIETSSFESMRELLQKAINGLVDQIEKQLIEKAHQAAEEGHPAFAVSTDLTADSIIAMFEKVDIEFDPWGRTSMRPMFHSSQKSQVEAIYSSPEFQARLQDILQKKWQQFNDRESNRKLA